MTRLSRLTGTPGWPLPPGDPVPAAGGSPVAPVNGFDLRVVPHAARPNPDSLTTAFPVETNPGEGVDAGGPIDYATVRLLRSRVADRLMPQLAGSGRLSELPDEDVHAAITTELDAWIRDRHTAGEDIPSREDEARLAAAVFDAAHGLGRLQPLLDLPGVDNIAVTGCDQVWLHYGDGRIVRGPAVADSDEDLVDDLRFHTQVYGRGRTLSTKDNIVDLRLPDGSRMAIIIDVTPRPRVTIRRHTAREATLDQLVAWGTLDPTLVAFLTTLVRARMNVLISGHTDAGKTTLLRAMLAFVEPLDEVVTVESEFELWLHQMPARHPRVLALEAKPGGPEIDSAGRPVGEVTETRLTWAALRHNPNRVIVGEVRGDEAVPMLRAMSTGDGSMCTTHADSARQAVDRIAELCAEHGGVSETFAYRRVASAVHYIVQLATKDQRARGGRLHRYVSEVLEVTPGEGGQPAFNEVFVPGPDGRAVHKTTPHRLDKLVDAGLDPSLLTPGVGAWPAPLQLLDTSW